MENENLKKEDYIVFKELMINKTRSIDYYISEYQNSVLNFCRNYNLFQNKENFFNLTLTEQFEFNECVEFSVNKLKTDFKQMEKFYTNCKEKCIGDNPYNREEIEEQIDKYSDASFDFSRPSLPPCISECKEMYFYLNKKYHEYMVKDLGIYSELINYKKLL